MVIHMPGVAAEWERTADAEDLRAVAAAADRLGFDFLTCSEHVLVPVEDAETRGGTYWDPVATLSYLAACTARIRLATSVVVLGYHHPLELAKRYGTLDEQAAAICFLASDEAAYITGTVLPVAGGDLG